MAFNLVRHPPQRLRRELQHICTSSLRVCSSAAPKAHNCRFDSKWPACPTARQIASNTVRRSRQRSLRRAPHPAFAAWGDDIQWSKATVVESSEAAQGLQRLVLDIGQEAGRGHHKAGQFVQLKINDSRPGFFAIASPPDPNNQGVIELLIKNNGVPAEEICSQPSGAEVLASPVQGKGFQVEKVPPDQFPTLVIFATGSGISPVRSLIESGELQAKQRKDVRLYYGTFNPSKTAYSDAVPQWEAAGIKVKLVFSDDGHGYVQDAFQEDGLEDGSRACAVLVGQKEMCLTVTDLLVSKGIDKGNILLNF